MMLSIGDLLLFLASFRLTVAHRSLPEGVSCSSQFYSPETALRVPNSTISWASYRIFTCDEKLFWLEADATAGQTLYFTAVVPVLERFADVRMTVAVIGPSLLPLEDSAVVPQEIRDYADAMEMGVAMFYSPQDQTTCAHLTAPLMIQESSVVDGRCHFYEPFGGSNSWVVLDQNLQVAEEGIYKIAVYVEGDTTAKASIACCEWPEDFVTDYAIPAVDCPFCGTKPEENPAWSSHFYEQKSMEQYGGFPPYESCSDPAAQDLQPTDEQCPPVTTGGPGDTQPPSCRLGCNSQGECHSHNVFGECTHQLTWDLQPKFGDADVSKVIIFKGDKINFRGTIPAHNLFEFRGQDAMDSCNFAASIPLANTEEVFVGHTVEFTRGGVYYFACGIGCIGFPEGGGEEDKASAGRGDESSRCHCAIGQKLTVEVLDSSDGLRCHDHGSFSNEPVEQVPDLTCDAGQVLVFAIDNPAYGAMDDTECAEFCTLPVALDFMPDVQQGSCDDAGFTGSATEKTVELANGMEILVHVKSNEEPSTCHCHSYEEIPCPSDEIPGDTLYDDHINEITEFCTGILDGTEEDCPFACFQPMEVLHLHYVECPLREVDDMYLAVNATGKCHIAATAPPGTDCPIVTFDDGDITDPSTTPEPSDSFELTPIHFEGCMQANGTGVESNVFLASCDLISTNIKQQWQYDAATGLIRSLAANGVTCIQAGHDKMPPANGGKVRIKGCDESEALQRFDWSSALGSPITLQDYPEYCLIFRGGSADLNIDPILVKKCAELQKLRRDGWMAMAK